MRNMYLKMMDWRSNDFAPFSEPYCPKTVYSMGLNENEYYRDTGSRQTYEFFKSKVDAIKTQLPFWAPLHFVYSGLKQNIFTFPLA